MSNRVSEVVEEQELPQEAIGWAARDSSGILSPFKFQRRATGAEDVTLKVLYCGVCHSDLALMKNDWGLSVYPLVPGHEIVGIVVEVGFKVEKFKVGDKVGIGLLVSSCQICEDCSNSLECYCPKFVASCYGKCNDDGTTVASYGGFSDIMVANMRYVVHIPDNLPLDGSAPLLCAGITVYSPMKYYGLTDPGMHVGVVGIGGLGHLAVKFAKAFGVKVTVISTCLGKKEEAIQRLGADSFLLSSDSEQLKAAIGTMDSIIDTVSSVHSLYPLIALLKNHGKLILVGMPDQPLELPAPYLAMGNKAVLGSFIGGMKSMQEMLDFAGKHNITADVEVVPMNYVNTAMERLSKSDVRYRFVLDIANSIKVEGLNVCTP